MEEKLTKKLAKSVGIVLVSIVLTIVAYFILTKFSDVIFLSDIVDISGGAIEEVASFAKEKLNWSMSFLENKSIYFALQLYWVASIPFGYYCLSKIFRITAISLFGLILLVLKVLASAFVGPVVFPVAFIIAIVNIFIYGKQLNRIKQKDMEARKQLEQIVQKE